MKNYYDELEVSKTASKDVIEKVYKVLAKKYHPDTTKEVDKQAAEEKFKVISEAYEVLSDSEKRKKYDEELEQMNPTISYEDYLNVINQRDTLNTAFNNLKDEYTQFKNSYNINNQAQYSNNTYNNKSQFNQQGFNNGYNNQTQYNHQNFNNGYNQSQYSQPNFNNLYNNSNVGPNTNNKNNTKGKKYYYNTVTGKPVSAFDYFKYRIRKFISEVGFYVILLLVLIMVIKSFTSLNLGNSLF